MIRPTVSKLQLESLRRTNTTKKQIIDSIANTPIDVLKNMIPNLDVDNKITHKSIIDNANKILNKNRPISGATDFVTEAIIMDFGRPVFFISNNLPVMQGNEIEKFNSLLTNSITNLYLGEKISSIGRIETDYLPGYDWLGTGWLFEDDLLITNRHVASEFISMQNNRMDFKNIVGKKVAARVDYIAEHGNNNSAEFRILECLYLASPNQHDIAILRVDVDSKVKRLPISILNGDARYGEDIAVIGYPAYDSRVGNVATMDRIYQKIYDVKRLAPGKIIRGAQADGFVLHDSTTLGGNSGSVVLSLESGKAVGLHFQGREHSANYSVASSVLRSVISKLPKKSYSLRGIDTTLGVNIVEGDVVEMVPRSCKLEEYTNVNVPGYKISGRIITYASPDSTYSVTKKMFDQATESILIGIYDFSAEHMVVCIKEAIDRGVSVSLMLDIDSEKENEVFKKLKRYGVECVPAPSCASKNVSYFSSSHEKVIVIDNEWTLIQSGNYSNNSIPFNEGDGEIVGRFKTGNRDMGIAIESKPLAKFFTKILRADMQLELSGPAEESVMEQFPSAEFLLEAPAKIPSVLFSSQEFNFNYRVNIQPILSPDNYMEVIPQLLSSAKKSIKIEQQYIRVGQKQIDKLLKAINQAKDNANGEFVVQIIVAPPIGNPDKTIKEVEVLRDMGFEVCMLSKKHFVHCHNKLIIIDDEAVLISSQNWSDSAVAKNREAGVIIYDKEITAYYDKIFNADWSMSEGDEEGVNELIVNVESISSSPGKYVVVDACDIQEV